METTVKKWFKQHEYGFLDNGQGPDILVRREALKNCQYLKIGAKVEFECHQEAKGLVALNVRLMRERNDNRLVRTPNKAWRGVMT